MIEFLKRWFTASKRLLELEAVLDELDEQIGPPDPPTAFRAIERIDLELMLRGIVGNILIYLADDHYYVTTVDEMRRFLVWAETWRLQWIYEEQDCEDFTRHLQGKLVCPGWRRLPALDCWYTLHGPFGGGHSRLMMPLIDEDGEIRLYLIEGQELDLIELAEEVFELDTPWLIVQ